jgi:hypothetical protein
VFWLARPPYLRWAGAILLVVTSLYFELRPEPGVLHPFAARDLAGGTVLVPELVVWRRVPVGLLPATEPEGVLRLDIESGEPLLPSSIGDTPRAPDGWWALELPVPAGTVSGAEVRLVVNVRQDPRVIPGLVIKTLGASGLDGTLGLVAVPEAEVGAAAAAAADHSLEVLVNS